MLAFRTALSLQPVPITAYHQLTPRRRSQTRQQDIHPPQFSRSNRAQITACSSSLPERLQSLCKDVSQQVDQKTRFMKLIRLGDSLPNLPDEHVSDRTRITGCTSVTHIDVAVLPDGTVSLRGLSDALIARGLLALIVLGLNGSTAAEIQAVSANDILSTSGLHQSTNMSRQAGISSILQGIQSRLRDANTPDKGQEALAESQTHPLHGRWTDRQGADTAILLSGGVDSSVAMRLAQESGARVQAFYLKIWLDDETAHLGECPWEEDMHYARAVCEQAGVRLHDVPFQREYWDEVVSYTVSEARCGHTPNPDVMCNTRIKFGAFFQKFGQQFDSIVTGHYARRVLNENGLAELHVSEDVVKDQTYFLSHLQQEQIAKARFPLGGLRKEETRELARRFDLANKDRKDSQGICFLGKLKFDDFLAQHLGTRRGSLVEFESGRELGFHPGFWFFTAGQRKGVRLSGGPWYVVAKDIEANIVYVSRRFQEEGSWRRGFDFERVVWISGDWPVGLSRIGQEACLRVKTRHGARFHDAVVRRAGSDCGHVVLEHGDKGLAGGQFAAFYDYEGRCLGSGVIMNEVRAQGLPECVIPLQAQGDAKRLQAPL